ncbi:hypothetical protein IE53DRAFT_389250 [Violaceomyces palustris]|uniref:Uncharacterized protein n=1 Tax=Violaceomyces palustris TaxID=1673888 RepID=A0ACD0NRS0_9BASI|nr:hypothetical protein IE53DRAFT_389250 [Violaceomyces palustris]
MASTIPNLIRTVLNPRYRSNWIPKRSLLLRPLPSIHSNMVTRSSSRLASQPSGEEPTPEIQASKESLVVVKSARKRKVEKSTKEETKEPEEKVGKSKPATVKKDEDEVAEQPKSKKTKRSPSSSSPSSDSPSAPTGNDTLAPAEFPKNGQVPETLSYEKRPEGVIRISAWNITSLKSAEPKGLFTYIQAEDADVLVLSETKVNDVPKHPKLSQYPYQYWGIGSQKGYAGLAILSKVKPLKSIIGLPNLKGYDSKGRIVTLEFPNSFLIGTYAVNAGEGLKTMDNKIAWNKALAEHLNECDKKKPVIWCGDLNVVLDERDLSQASKKWNKSPGYTQIECDAHRRLLEGKETGGDPFVDIWRHKHPDAVGHYTFYGWRGGCRGKGIGWRLDTFILSERIKDSALECEIRHEVYGASDHVPIFCDIRGPL